MFSFLFFTSLTALTGIGIYFLDDATNPGGSKYTKKKCAICGKMGKKQEMVDRIYAVNMQVVYYCPECYEEREKTPEQKKVEFVERERGF